MVQFLEEAFCALHVRDAGGESLEGGGEEGRKTIEEDRRRRQGRDRDRDRGQALPVMQLARQSDR